MTRAVYMYRFSQVMIIKKGTCVCLKGSLPGLVRQ